MQYYTAAICDAYNAQTWQETTVARDLQNPAMDWWIVTVRGEVAGYAKLMEREPPACLDGLPAIYLKRIYIAKAYHRLGIGQRLMGEIYAAARRRGYRWLWLSVWEYNVPAVNFYRKLGFHQAGTWEWKFRDEASGKEYIDIDWVMTIGVPA